MYFPTSTARRLSTVPALPNIPPENVLTICPSPRKSLFCTLTRNGISIWRVRPSANLAFLSRTPISIIDHGENREAHWSPDGSRIVIKTSDSYLVLLTVIFHPNETSYQAPPLSANARRNFLAGSGEAFPLSSVSLQFEGVIRVEGTLVRIHQRYKGCLGQQRQKKSWRNRGSDEDTFETIKTRLFHYFPPSNDASVSHTEDEAVDSWCGFHLDHSLLTGLCSTGEALEVATGGKLRATPHCVRVGGSPGVGKSTVFVFAISRWSLRLRQDDCGETLDVVQHTDNTLTMVLYPGN
ncbi:hypothetical protein F5876DRAFT_65687 [Lentinula aff. lateritia]|uniref:Uncharacterized protein n=1 Tax=Lentinula aff. lateritia TaxID=2804960 RepID=A0ACC1U1B5_9AGAR|nr:hypothetical protein F5876DRAFT_65687 [Lentinula aff. lateritia]